MADLTGQNIQDSYQKVVQVDEGQLQDGTGSNLPISFDGDNVIITGSLTAHKYILSSSITNMVIATKAGSTAFGNSSDDVHTFTGRISAPGSAQDAIATNGSIVGGPKVSARTGSFNVLTLTNNLDPAGGEGQDSTLSYTGLRNIIRAFSTTEDSVNARNFASNVGFIENFASTVGSFGTGTTTIGDSISSTGNIEITGSMFAKTNITASGNISSSGAIRGGSYFSDSSYAIGATEVLKYENGHILLPEPTVIEGHLDIQGGHHITASGNISASGHLIGQIGILSPAFGENAHDPASPGGDIVVQHLRGYNAGGANRTGKIKIGVGQITIHPQNLSSTSIVTNGLQLYGGQNTYGVANNPSINTDNAGDLELKINNNLVAKIEPAGIDLTGHITASGNISSSAVGTVTAGSGSFHHLIGDTTKATGLFVNGQITASGNISASGNLLANEFYSDGRYYSDGEVIATNSANASQTDFGNSTNHVIISADRLSLGSPGATTHITASGDISSSGTITANEITSIGQTSVGSAIYIGANGHRIHQDPNNASGLNISSPLSVDGNITASGNISASGNIYGDELWLNNKLRIYNNVVGQRISGSGEIFFASNKFEFSDTNISIEGPPEFMRINGDTNVLGHITASGDISASGNLYGAQIFGDKIFNSELTNGRVIFTGTVDGRQGDDADLTFANETLTVTKIDTTHITASANISASGNINAQTYNIVDTQIISQLTSVAGNTTLKIGNVNNFTEIEGTNIKLDAPITASGDISASGIIYGSRLMAMEAGLSTNAISNLSQDEPYIEINNNFDVGIGDPQEVANGTHILIDDTNTKIDFETLSAQFGGHITASGNISTLGNISSSGDVNANSFSSDGNFAAIWNGSTMVFGTYQQPASIRSSELELNQGNLTLTHATNGHITASGNISSSGTVQADGFIGQRVYIGGASANISSPTQNKYFYGGSNGLGSNTWNVQVTDPTAIPPQYINNLHIIPCGVKNVTLKSNSRCGSSQNPTIWIYTGSIDSDSNANISMGFAASQSIHSPADGETNGSGTHSYHINITGSRAFAPNLGHELIAVMMKNEGSGTQAWRFNYRLDGITTE